MKVGILGLLHESNTFSSQPTTIDSFRDNLLVSGDEMVAAMQDAHHEVGGFLSVLQRQQVQIEPLLMARALPSGPICRDDFDLLMQHLESQVQRAGPLDGLLVAPHGATVSESVPDADGYWLSFVRQLVGPTTPIVGTLDAHANVSRQMVDSCDALVAYRTNPHLDQRARGEEAADILMRTLHGEIKPTMAAAFPSMAISIDRQCTEESHLRPLYEMADLQLSERNVVSNSILLGFPYADVAEMGSSTVVVTDNAPVLAQQLADRLANEMWNRREDFRGVFVSVEAALEECFRTTERTCLLDMGDNVGGGSSADGTQLIAALQARRIGPTFACLFDPAAVLQCQRAGIAATITLNVGGKVDRQHGPPLSLTVTIRSQHDGKFREPAARHGGISEFDQGPTVVCETTNGLTLMLTSKRMVPFSLQQLISCDIDPSSFRILVAKGVNAPIAAYREVCDRFIRANTIGSTCADMTTLNFKHRRVPLFPFRLDGRDGPTADGVAVE